MEGSKTGTQQQHNTRLKAKKAEERGLEKLKTPIFYTVIKNAHA